MSLRKSEHGTMVYSDPGADSAVLEIKTHQCCHCGGQFTMKPQKLIATPLTPAEAIRKQTEGVKVRGWCQNCSGYICGPGCAACVNFEQYLENIEKGRPADFKPIIVSVPGFQ